MPSVVDPERGWVGSANHRVVPGDYPYVYSTHFSHSWRYRRLRSLLEGATATSAGDHWRFALDVRNEMAARIAPFMVRALRTDRELSGISRVLEEWDYRDAVDASGAALFQSIYRTFARLTFEDDLGEALTREYLDDPYYWQERLARLVASDATDWFDDRRTPALEPAGTT